MSAKRSRQAFEADARAEHSPFVAFGTPLPPLDPEVRDDGSFVPIWKQEARDEQGRKRLHGAFTGGWSAGYFNTVGSKEGWTPSTFVSSRTNRHNDVSENTSASTRQQRPEDFMDAEDLADAAEAQKIQTAESFAGLGITRDDGTQRGAMMDLFRAQGDTMGAKLLRRMGWKEGQGIGPKVRRRARLDTQTSMADEAVETHLFAPDDVSLVAFVKKLDQKGLGFEGAPKLTSSTFGKSGHKSSRDESSDDDDEDHHGPALKRPEVAATTKSKSVKGGFGIGVLNDNGSGDEDPYEMGPKISYNKVLRGEKKKKSKLKPNPTASTAFGSAPKFKSRKDILAMAGRNLRKCHDGRLPLEGFVFARDVDTHAVAALDVLQYPPPTIPPDWVSSKSKITKDGPPSSGYLSTADAAKASSLDPKSRAALLGEAQLPGKSVFDFLSPEARERLASASGKANLPPALNEIPEGYALSEDEKQAQMLRQIPQIDKQTAAAALGRGAAGSGPYADNEAKRTRYRQFLEYFAGFSQQVPQRPPNFKDPEWLRELNEFYSCARIFKPMTGMMASRFTTSSGKLAATDNSTSTQDGDTPGDKPLIHRPPPKPTDPAEEAAKMGMYGHMTRSSADFYPTRLLCKRFNVRPPAHVVPDTEVDSGVSGAKERKEPDWGSLGVASLPSFASAGLYQQGTTARLPGDVTEAAATPPQDAQGHASSGGMPMTLDELMASAQMPASSNEYPVQQQQQQLLKQEAEVNADVNDALEGKRAEDSVLRAIFGDSSDDEDD